MRLVITVLLVLAENLVFAADDIRPITEADTVLAVYVEDWGLASSGAPKLIMAIWGDGHAVWSEDRILGGAPYRSGQVDREKVASLIARLQKEGLFGNKKLARAHFGPDSQFTSILIKSGKQQLNMQSWHELFEDNGKTVATSHGIEALNGRRRVDVLAAEDSEYLHYRLVWAETRLLISSLVPTTSAPRKGQVLMKAGKMLWRELANE